MPTKPPLIVWWLIWGAILSAFFGLYGIFSQFVELRPASGGAAALAGVVPLALGATCRFLLLPRLLHTAKGFPVFIVGLALAEAGGLVGVFLAGDHKVYFAAAALVLIILHAPGLLRSGH